MPSIIRKKTMKKILLSLTVLVIVGVGLYSLFVGNNQQTPQDQDESIKVMVSILPQVKFVESIGGDKVQATAMIPPGFSPATYDPAPEQLQKLQEAEIYFRIGHIPFEKSHMEKLISLNPEMMVVDTSQGVELLTMAAHDHGEDEPHQNEDEHGHQDESEEHEHEAGDDPHIWLSPRLVKIQAQHIYEALIELEPENKDYFAQNYQQFIQDLDELDQTLATAFAPIKDQEILVFHPAFGYLAAAYGFHQQAIEIEGKDPTPAQLQLIIDEAREDNVQVVFVQKQFSTKSAQSVAEAIDGVVVQIDPLAEDYFTNLESMAETMVSSIQ